MDRDAAHRLVSRATAGDELAVGQLVDLLTPVIQARVARVLMMKRPPGDVRSVRPQVEDFTQEILLVLFDDGARVLASWRQERGLSLENFVGLVARRRTLSILRTGKGNPWKEDPTLPEDLDCPAPTVSAEKRAASRELVRQLLDRLREELSPDGWHLFELLLMRELSVEEVRRATGKSREAVWAWSSRLKRLARTLLEEIESGGGDEARIDSGGR